MYAQYTIKPSTELYGYRMAQPCARSWQEADDPFVISPVEEKPQLMSFNGIGTRLLGHFRTRGTTYVSYQFLTIVFMPIIPLACYRVEEVDSTNLVVYSSTQYRFLGHARTRLTELALIYLMWWTPMCLLFWLLW